jgi:hypothetical protein
VRPERLAAVVDESLILVRIVSGHFGFLPLAMDGTKRVRSNVKGLESVLCEGPCSVNIDTVYRAEGKMPEVFLRGAGVPDSLIAYMKSLVVEPIDYYSCFISYSTKDQKFADLLRSQLQTKGVRVTTMRGLLLCLVDGLFKRLPRSPESLPQISLVTYLQLQSRAKALGVRSSGSYSH